MAPRRRSQEKAAKKLHPWGKSPWVLFLACSGIAALGAGAIVAVSGREPVLREGNSGEDLAGILGAARAFAALLGGDTVADNRNTNLHIPLQTDDGKLAQCHVEPAAFSAEDQLLIKQRHDPLRKLGQCPILTGTLAHIQGLPCQDHGIQNLHHSHRQIPAHGRQAVRGMDTGIAGKDMCCAVLTAKHRPFGKYRKAMERRRSCASHHGIGKDPVEEGHINTEMASVKGHRFHGGLLRLENFRRRFHHFRHHPRRYHRLRFRLQS